MSSVIDFLERLGQDASLRRAANDSLEDTVELANLAPAEREALLGRISLDALLGVRATCALIHAPEDDEEETEDEPKEDDEDNEPAPERARSDAGVSA